MLPRVYIAGLMVLMMSFASTYAEPYPWEVQQPVDDAPSAPVPVTVPKPSVKPSGKAEATKDAAEEDDSLPWLKNSQPSTTVESRTTAGPDFTEWPSLSNVGLESLRQRVARQEIEAIYELGMRYYEGRDGVEQDYRKSFPLLKRVADVGYAPAQYNVARSYRYGRGVKESQALAFEWYSKAAEQGYGSAECAVGNALQSGRGVSKNPVAAMEWLERAVAHGNAAACHSIGNIYYYDESVPEHLEIAVKWYRKAADRGSVDGVVALAICAGKGKGMEADPKMSYDLYKRAAYEMKPPSAQAVYSLGRCYELGTGTKVDDAKATACYARSAEMGFSYGMFNMGRTYKEGRGVDINYDEAIRWFKLAEAAGHQDASEAIERCRQLQKKASDDKVDENFKVVGEFLEAVGELFD